jgi:excisionase family DNA binding protein
MEISVPEAAERLGLDQSRVRFLLRDGAIPGRRAGGSWLVDGDAIALMATRGRPGGRPLATSRAWAALDLLAGGDAPWVTPSARSQVRGVLRRLEAAGPDGWRGALRNRCDPHLVAGHSAAVNRLLTDKRTVAGGPRSASDYGLDLVAVGARHEVYVDDVSWQELARSLRLREQRSADAPVLVRVVGNEQLVRRLHSRQQLRAMAVAADCLEAPDPRAVRAGYEFLSAAVGSATHRSR